jgi:SAM-dependent methyltransferase
MNNSNITNRFPLGRIALDWFRDSMRYRGVTGTLAEFGERIWEFARDLTPERRRSRYGDLQFDFDHGVNTTWSNVGLRTRVREIFAGEKYQPIEADQFHEMMMALKIDFRGFTFIDLGSGKGRALLLASEYPFTRIMGAEILPELHAIAEENFRRFKSDRQRCFRLESWCGDARQFEFPDEPTLLYLFNPFYEPVLGQLLENLRLSLNAIPRKLLLLYANPLAEEVIERAGFLKKTGGTHQYSIFEPVL